MSNYLNEIENTIFVEFNLFKVEQCFQCKIFFIDFHPELTYFQYK